MTLNTAVDSLLVADQIELLGGPGGVASPSSAGEYAGVIFKLNYGYDLSSPQTTVDILAALSGDGERPYGRRASNRSVNLPVMVDASQIAGLTMSQQWSALAAAVEQLMYLVDNDTWRLTWTRRIGNDPHLMPLVLDCFRAQPAQVTWGGVTGDQGYPIAVLTLTFSALPYGRDDVPQTIDFQTPLAGLNVPPSFQPIDQYNNNFLTGANSTFEGGLGNWVALANCAVADSASPAHSGAYSMQLTSTAAGTMTATSAASYLNGLPCNPGDSIFVSFWALAATTGRAVSPQIAYYTSGGSLIATHGGGAPTDATGFWTYASFLDTAPATSAFALFVGQVASTGAGGEVHYFDDVVLADQTIAAIAGGWGYQKNGPGTGNTVYYDPALPSLPNQPWQMSWVGNGSTANPQITATNYTPVVALKSYAADVWFYATAVFNMQVVINWYTSGLSLISQVTAQTVTVQTNQATRVMTSSTAPATAAFARIEFRVSGTPATSVVFYAAGGSAIANALTNAGNGTASWFGGNGATPTQLQTWANAPGGTTGDYSAFATGQGQGPAVYTASVPDINLESLTAVTLWAGFASTLFFPMWCKKGGAVLFVVTFTDQAGNTISVQRLQTCYGSDDASTPRWVKIRIPLPHTTGFNWADIVSYTLTVSNRSGELWFTRLFISDLRGEPPADLAYSQPQSGAFYELHEVAGEARAQLSLRCQMTGTPASYTQIFSNAGSYTWIAPVGCTAVTSAFLVGGGAAGASIPPTSFGGGGGGGGGVIGTSIAVTAGRGYPVNVGQGGFQLGFSGGQTLPTASTFSGDSASLVAPGASVTPGNGSGGTGGAAGTGGTGFTGGNGGAAGASVGGGGGGSAGSAANGNVGSNTGTGGAAVTGGGAGGTGAASGPGGGGTAPGGGGGGGGFGGHGGPGRAGLVSLTYNGLPNLFTLIAHRPSFGAPAAFVPFVQIPRGDSPAGSIQYPVPSYASGVLARFNGTYTVVACPYSWNSPSASRTITVTITQLEIASGNTYTTSVQETIIPNNLVQITGPNAGTGFAVLGEVTLPPNLMSNDNVGSYFTVSITDTNTSDRFQDILFLDTQGSTVTVQSPQGYANLWIDEPDTSQDIGYVLASINDRANAVSVMDRTIFGGPPPDVDPYGNRSLLLYSLEGVPACEAYYFPRHFLERTAQ